MLDELCRNDGELRGEVESLLGASSQAEAFLEKPFAEPVTASVEDEGQTAAPPERIGPYVVQREIGRGGMGVVYLARHEGFPKVVALKVLRSGLDNDLLRSRFRRERDILAGLEHPGIARLHDAGTAEDGTPYLAMEPVEGATLLGWADAHELTTAARVDLFLEVCAAVEYAHQRRVLHRDLKPSNIVVTCDGTPKLLDFGVAKLLAPPTGPEGASDLTMTGAPLMTPEYASPEQVRGEALGPASDVYSLAVVFYELLTGHRPYRLGNRSPREIAKAVCETDPETPSVVVGRRREAEKRQPAAAQPGRDARREGSAERLHRSLRGDLDAIVLKALRKDVGTRYGSVAELAADLRRHRAGLPVAARRGTWRYRTAKYLRRHAGTAAMIVLLAVGLVAGLVLARVGRDVGSGASAARHALRGSRRAVAILPFKNLSRDARNEWISPTLEEMLRTELAAGGTLRIVPGEQVAQALRELDLPAADGFGEATLARIRRKLGSDLVVLGAFLASPAPDGALRVDVRVQDCRAGETLVEFAETGSPGAILELVTRAGVGLRSGLGLTLSPQETAGLRAVRPTSPAAARAYSEGVALVRRLDYQHARPLLEQAVAADPGFVPAHLELATVFAAQEYRRAAADRARAALALVPTTRGTQRLLAEARIHQVLQDWEGAIRAYRALRVLDPEDLELGLSLVRMQSAANRKVAALATLRELRDLPPPARDDPRIDLEEGYLSLDSKERGRVLASAVTKARALGATLILAQARRLQGLRHREEGDFSRETAAYEEARRLFAEGGDRVNAGRCTIYLANSRFMGGDPDVAVRLLRDLTESPDTEDLPAVRRLAFDALGWVEGARVNMGMAARAYAQALELSHRLGSGDEPVYSANIGLSEFHVGRAAEGRKAIQRARAEVVGHAFWTIEVSSLLAITAAEVDPAAVADLVREGTAADGSDASYVAPNQYLLGHARLVQGDIDSALATLASAVHTLDESGQPWAGYQARLSLAEAQLAAGDAVASERTARGAGERRWGWSVLSPELPSGSAALARALLEQGRVAEANAAFAPVRAAADRTDSMLHRLAVSVDGARLRAAGGDARGALAELESIAAEAQRHGYRLTAYRARLARGQILLHIDREAAARGLRALEHDAGRSGFGLIVAQARAAMASRS